MRNGPCIAEFGHTGSWGVSLMRYERFFGSPVGYRYSKVFQCHQVRFFWWSVWWNVKPFDYSKRPQADTDSKP